MIISQNSNDVYYAYTRGRFWRWDESARVWKESHLLAQKFGKAKTAEKRLTPEAFLTSDEFIPMDDYELPQSMLTALREAKPCKNAPVDPVEEEPEVPGTQTAQEKPLTTVPDAMRPAEAAEPFGNIPAAPTFDFSALGDLSQQAADADQQFDLHYGAAQDEYLISCIYLARIHALTAKAGRYGGGTWTKWYESKGLSHGSVTKMVQNGEAFNSSTVDELKQLPNLTRKDLNLIARSGCADQVVAAAGDSQRVQDLLAQIKSKDAQLEAAHADISGLKDRATAAEAREEEAWSMVSKAQDEAKAAQENLDYEVSQNDALHEEKGQLLRECEAAKQARAEAEARAQEAEKQLEGSRQVAEAAKLRGDKLKAENDALKKQPIAAVVDEEEVERRANQRAHDIAEDLAAEMTADLQARLEQASSGSEQDARDAYDGILLAGRNISNAWQAAKLLFPKMPPEQRETAADQLIHTLGQIQGEVSRCL